MTDSRTEPAPRYVPSPGCPPPHPAPRRPSLVLPPDACDAHCHVFGPGDVFPYAEDRTFTPVDAPRAQVAAVQTFLGLSRGVIVQSACNGRDHSVLIDALTAEPARFRGVALVDDRMSAGEIADLDAAGVRGYRLNFLSHLGAAPLPETVRRIAARAADIGWHAQIHVAGDGIVRHRALIESLPGRLIIDHLGRVDLGEGLTGPSVRATRELIDTGRVWVKLSGIDRVSRTGPPYADAVELAAMFVRHAPERVLWGTDYPHPNIAGAAPDDGLLVDLVERMAPTAELRQSLLVDNPAELFGF